MEDFKPCEHREFCGGCIYQGVHYEEQLTLKEQQVRQSFASRNIEPEQFDNIEGCPSKYRFRYRNKMEYSFGDMAKGGATCLGLHKKGSFLSVITTDRCQLVDEDFNKILRYTLDFAVKHGYSHYNCKRHEGLLRHLVIRKGARTKELLVNIVTTSEGGFGEEAYKELLFSLPLDNRIAGILRTFNDNIADRVTPEKIKTLWGRDFYIEEVFGLKFKVGAFSFFQTNVEAAERLYGEVLGLAGGLERKTVFDLYCGTGTISRIMALRAEKVIGVEINEESVKTAREDVRLYGPANCGFIAGDVFDVLESMGEKPDIIVTDPPRAGMGRKAVAKTAGLGAGQIIYISCNPKSLAADLEQFRGAGYEVKYAKPFDNFPMTKHVETIVLLSRKAD